MLALLFTQLALAQPVAGFVHSTFDVMGWEALALCSEQAPDERAAFARFHLQEDADKLCAPRKAELGEIQHTGLCDKGMSPPRYTVLATTHYHCLQECVNP